jgi:hypothetical protein
MYKLLKYTDLDSAIQTRMSNQAPNTDTRLEYINDFMLEMITTYDIEVAKRSIEVSITPNGVAVDIDTLIPNLDVKSIKDIRQVDPELNSPEYTGLDESDFAREYNTGVRANRWSFYTENGKRYLKLNSYDQDGTVAVDYKITYYTTNLAIDENESSNNGFIPEVINSLTCYLLIPQEYKEMAIAGITRYLFLISLGITDGEKYAAIAENKFKSQLTKFGLNKDASKKRVQEGNVKIYPLTR